MKKTMMMIDDYILEQHVKKLCRPNLKDRRVKCCATCAFESIICELYPELKDVFVEKRKSIKENEDGKFI